jgi:hypothetical protein
MQMTRCALLFSVVVLLAVALPASVEKYDYRIELDGNEIAIMELSIDSESATATVEGFTEHFDLKNQRWQDDESKQWVTLKECEAWAKKSKEESSKSALTAPEDLREFIQWSLDPKFDIAFMGDTLTLTSGQVDYKIVVEKPTGDVTNYFRYARLNSYKKAMTEKKLAPFAELLVLEELERRKVLPKSMEVQITGVPEAPSFKITISDSAKAE